MADSRRDVKLVHELYFPLQPSKDVAFEIGRIFMGLKDFESAAELFRSGGDVVLWWECVRELLST